MPRSARSIAACAIVALLGTLAPARLDAAEGARPAVLRGYDLALNLDHDEAVEVLTRAALEHPDDPAVHRAIAVVTWLRILFVRGAILVDNYLLGSISASSMTKRSDSAAPADLDTLFKTHIERSIELATEATQRAPDSSDAHYELGASVALATSYVATVEGDPLRALRDAKRAYAAHERVVELDPSRKDANLILGLYRYLVSSLPRVFRMVAYLVGFDGGKEEAIRLIEEAAAYPSETQAEAQIALVVLYNREEAFGAAQRVLGDLKRRYPRNRLFWLESASTWLRDERAEMAERTLQEGFEKLSRDGRERMIGEEAVWFLKRGTARVLMGRRAEAREDLLAARDAESAAWVNGYAHLELGKIADLEGDRERARAEYDRGLTICDDVEHRRCISDARRLRRQGFALD